MVASEPIEFDVARLVCDLDARRAAHALSWRGVADEMWARSEVLNRRRNDHPISPSTIVGLSRRGDTSCQHALVMLRWLEACPEEYLPGWAGDLAAAALPAAGPDRRLRWDLGALAGSLEVLKRERAITWSEAARTLRCTTSQLTGIRTARFAIGMRLAMRIVQLLGEPAATFVTVAAW